MKIKPMQGIILVKEIKPENKTEGGLLIPDSANQKSLIKAKVISCGEKTINDSPDIVEGAIVLFVQYSASDIEDNGDKFYLVGYSEIKGVVEEE